MYPMGINNENDTYTNIQHVKLPTLTLTNLVASF